ncbi:MAG: HAD family hydrolase, partial [Bdellovibrionia bacterium]
MPDRKIFKSPKVIVLDFDGVVVESNQVKDEAFRQVFVEYDRHVNEVFEYHLANPALNRFEKFDHIQKHILKDEEPEIVHRWAHEFSQSTLEGVSACPMVEGAQDFLEYFLSLGTRLYLASMTPQDDLMKILKTRALNRYFVRAYGAPLSKAETLRNIATIENVELT